MADDPHEFVFEIDLAIRTQVIQKLEASPKLNLTEDVGPYKRGVYVLYWKGKMVYAGKALQVMLGRRLKEHARKKRRQEEHIPSRHELQVSDDRKRLVRTRR